MSVWLQTDDFSRVYMGAPGVGQVGPESALGLGEWGWRENESDS